MGTILMTPTVLKGRDNKQTTSDKLVELLNDTTTTRVITIQTTTNLIGSSITVEITLVQIVITIGRTVIKLTGLMYCMHDMQKT